MFHSPSACLMTLTIPLSLWFLGLKGWSRLKQGIKVTQLFSDKYAFKLKILCALLLQRIRIIMPCFTLQLQCFNIRYFKRNSTADYLIVFSLPPLDYGSTPSVTLMNKMRYMTAFSYKLALFIYTYRSVWRNTKAVAFSLCRTEYFLCCLTEVLQFILSVFQNFWWWCYYSIFIFSN